MDPSLLTSGLQSTFDSLGITKLTGLFITITAMSGSFYFILGIIRPPIETLWNHLKQLTFYEVSIYIADPDFQKFNTWLNTQQKYTWFQRTYKVVNVDERCDSEHYALGNNDTVKESELAPGYGSVLIKAPGHPFILVTRIKVENKNVYKQTETLTFKIFSFSKSKINKFFNEVVTKNNDDMNPIVYSYDSDWWAPIGKTKAVLPPLGKSAQEFIDDVDYFLKNEEEYRIRGISYKRGYLLFGLPGTGKTSIIAYLSRKYKMNIYTLNSSTIAGFHKCAGDIKPRSIILIEDIDMTVAGQNKRNLKVKPSLKTIVEGKGKKSDKAVTETDVEEYTEIMSKEAMRDFLNTLDGITEFEGHLVIATTNKRNILDEALLRPGRIDKHIEIELFTYVEQIQHVNRFYQVELDPENYSHVQDRTFAVLQDMCVNNLEDYKELVKLL